ncbi:HlyD family secretion protein [Sphingobacterium sp. PCS056]|jgi:membrane fusion protein (multidrug efflux system)|uniref:HlyD family secretion protein n=1 Tax=unclassified Sphingobacterium TaxID=2609468 RepID=UPI00200C0852|nr:MULTISPECIES: HlyD family secretion protein [unclassified Sphingobacterium]UPZ36213.1 HlyD family secretion protein [Sphingobacterium sp. PCS056]
MKPKSRWLLTDAKLTTATNWIAVFVLCALLFWGVRTLWIRLNYAYTNDAQVTQYINPIISRIGGYVVSVHYQDHQIVKRGDTLLIIDNREYKYEADQANASVYKEHAEMNVLSSQKHILMEEHESLKKSIAANEARVTKQQLEFDRYEFLYEEKSATAQQLEAVKATLDVYKSELAALQHKLQASQERVHDVEVQKTVVNAEKNRLSAAAGRKHLDVGYTIVRAPYDGMIGKRSIEEGQMISSGEVLGFIVNAETPTWVTANFKETQLRFLHIHDQVEVIADAYPDRVFKGKIISISPATGSSFSLLPPDNATGNFVKIVQRIPVRIELDKKQGEQVLRSGMNVNVSIAKHKK